MMRALLVLLLLSAAASTSAAQGGTVGGPICPGLYGWQAERCVRLNYAPANVLDYDAARDSMFAVVWRQTEVVRDTTIAVNNLVRDTTITADTLRFVEGLYGGARAFFDPDSAGSPRRQAQDLYNFNTEHIWPQSRGASRGAARSDLHHLAPTFGPFNSARSNRAFTDNWRHIYKWHKGRTTRYVNSDGNPARRDLSSGTESDFQRAPDDGNSYESVAEQGRFVPRYAARGPAARAAAYFLVMYGAEARSAGEGFAFIGAMLDEIQAWADWGHNPQWMPTQAEDDRNAHVERIQGNRNPFVDDPTLFDRVFNRRGQAPPRPRNVWINEIHAENDGPDTGEGVEIAGLAGADLYGFALWFYSRSGHPYAAELPGFDERQRFTIFTGTLAGQVGLSVLWVPAAKVRGGCNGVALVDPDGVPVQFLSYGGCRFNALSGPVHERALSLGADAPSHPDSLVWSDAVTAPGRWSAQEWGKLPAGQSLQLTGAGASYDNFTWSLASTSPGAINTHQSHTGAFGNSTSHPSSPPSGGGARQGGGGPVGGLSLLLHPNPARSVVRFTAPPGTRVDLYDALGRPVPTHRTGPRTLDVSHLPPGLYLARFTGGPSSAVRSFTVVR
jgi:endonuclease I